MFEGGRSLDRVHPNSIETSWWTAPVQHRGLKCKLKLQVKALACVCLSAHPVQLNMFNLEVWDRTGMQEGFKKIKMKPI